MWQVRIAILAICLGMAAMAAASPITWTLVNASGQSANPITGTFTVDLDLPIPTLVAWNVNISGFGFPPLFPYTDGQSYANGSSTGSLSPDFKVITLNNGYSATFLLSAPLTDAGGTVSFGGDYNTLSSFNGVNSNQYLQLSGQLTSPGETATTPEPATWALVATGLLGLFWVRRRRAGAITPRSGDRATA